MQDGSGKLKFVAGFAFSILSRSTYRDGALRACFCSKGRAHTVYDQCNADRTEETILSKVEEVVVDPDILALLL